MIAGKPLILIRLRSQGSFAVTPACLPSGATQVAKDGSKDARVWGKL